MHRVNMVKALARSAIPSGAAILVACLPGLVSVGVNAMSADEDDPLFRDAAKVNEGDLHFIPSAPEGAHHHHNSIGIVEESLRDGWVKLRQCHRNLDAVGSAQIVFRKDHIREIKIESVTRVGQAWVENASVQLRTIGREAELCLSAESRALHDNLDGSYSLKNGPFMRRFLDGYYPMRVTMSIDFPPLWQVQSIHPREQQGFQVRRIPGQIQVDTSFEGTLSTEIRFSEPPDSNSLP